MNAKRVSKHRWALFCVRKKPRANRITGSEHFYQRLVVGLDRIITDMPTDNSLEVGCKKLEDEIKASRILDL